MTAPLRNSMAMQPTRVLVVDDSAVAREVLSAVLRRDGFEVDTASSGQAGLQRVLSRWPDVIVLDLEMPGMTGLEFLEHVMVSAPVPVVVCSGIAQPGAAAAIRALELGAVEVVPKPAGGIRAILDSDDAGVGQAVRAAASARTRHLGLRSDHPTLLVPSDAPAVSARSWGGAAIVIGASTGGTEALRVILSQLPADAPPVAIVQHMPGAFTGAFAQRLDSLCAVNVREARDGDVLKRGVALIAPGGRHMELYSSGGTVRVRVFDGLVMSGHRPSVDVLFRSAARTLGHRAVGALLTGMGADGAEGLLSMREEGAHTIAQNEATSVVYGMPGEAVAIGAAAQVSALQDIADAILAAANFRATASPTHEPRTTARLVP
jgi:two-component system, chemotaxis family, protein-glutamate methylesterase/glutaminase